MGPTEGPPCRYHWRGWDLLPPALPWLAILGLLTCKANRRWSAWWIWLPLVCVAVGVAVGWHNVAPRLQEMRSVPWLKQELGVLFEVPPALAFGVAALALLVPRLDCSQRFGTGLRILVLLAGLSVACFAVAGFWNEGVGQGALPLLLVPGLVGLNVAAAVILSGVACRRYRPFRLWLWASVWLVVLAFVVAVPAYFVAVAVWPFPLPPLSRVLFPLGLLIAVVNLGTLLPFLVLVLANPLYRERIKALFGFAQFQQKPETNPTRAEAAARP